jgi:hypothetical protein
MANELIQVEPGSLFNLRAQIMQNLEYLDQKIAEGGGLTTEQAEQLGAIPDKVDKVALFTGNTTVIKKSALPPVTFVPADFDTDEDTQTVAIKTARIIALIRAELIAEGLITQMAMPIPSTPLTNNTNRSFTFTPAVITNGFALPSNPVTNNTNRSFTFTPATY